MANQYAISARKVSKAFPHRRGHAHALHEAINNTLFMPLRQFKPPDQLRDTNRTLWALKDVSFEIQPGECVALIGHNGAGKSVLLRILSRVTRPTYGEAELLGHISSVLEVGVGFNRELSGRDNIFLQGAILGMRQQEIKAKFDEIVAFSGLEEFLQDPIKTFSNGMLVRMAFAIAAHLDPDVLLMDEILAVADAEFQQICISKLSSLTQAGRTILIASHDMDLLAQLCSRALWLEHGQLVADDKFESVAKQYQTKSSPTTSTSKG
jgi:lipopolysaccharide transport system ATP-binding protein